MKQVTWLYNFGITVIAILVVALSSAGEALAESGAGGSWAVIAALIILACCVLPSVWAVRETWNRIVTGLTERKTILFKEAYAILMTTIIVLSSVSS